MSRALVILRHSCGNDCSKCRELRANTLKIIVEYTDATNGINLIKPVLAPKLMTIEQLIDESWLILGLDNIEPEDLTLQSISVQRPRTENKYYGFQQTLSELGIEDGDRLRFALNRPPPPLKISLLTVFGPDEKEKGEFPWYRPKTILKELMDFVITTFSLEHVERHCIHLATYYGEINVADRLDGRLWDLRVADEYPIFVHIVGNVSAVKENEVEHGMVHVIARYGNNSTVTFDVCTETTLDELRSKIEDEVHSNIYEWTLFNHFQKDIDTSDLKRQLKSFDIQRDQTIHTFFSLRSTKRKAKAPTSNSLPEDGKVTVILKWRDIFRLSIPMSIQTTLNELSELQGELLKENTRLVPIRIQTEHGDIDMKHNRRHRLVDCDIQPGEKIYIEMEKPRLVRSSLTTNSSEENQRKIASINSDNGLPLGLSNLGNSCYMNSAFQCLARIPPLTDYFLKNLNLAVEDWNPFKRVGLITGNFANLLWNLLGHNEENEGLVSIEAANIRESFIEGDIRFNPKDQQDVQEFTNFLLTALHREMKQCYGKDKPTIVKELFYGQIQSTITCTNCEHEESISTPISFLSLPLHVQERKFYIQFISQNAEIFYDDVIVSTDGRVEDVVKAYAEKQKDPQLFYFLLATVSGQEVTFKKSLHEIPEDEIILLEQEKDTKNHFPKQMNKNPKKCTLKDCLCDFLSAETLENEWTCPRAECGKRDFAKKQLKLIELPPVLVIHFKRFSHFNGAHVKIETYIEYPVEGLDLSEFVQGSSKETRYDLVGVCYHTGFMYNGHYTASARCVKNDKIEWYTFDDQRVRRIPDDCYLDDIITRNAYLLFYVRRDLLTAT